MAAIRRVVRGMAALSVLGLAGCSAAPTGDAGAVQGATPHYNPETRRLERVTLDRNGDGRVDATTYMDGALVTRAEYDEDFDGTLDRWEHYAGRPQSGSSGTPTATPLERVEISARPDGRVTRWERYERGALRAVEEDTDGDGRVDKWETWEDGALAILAVDSRGGGRPDRRLVYGREGGEPQLEIDADGSGTFTRAAGPR